MTILYIIPAYAEERVEVAPAGSEFKPYMDYNTITDTRSPQYALQQIATTDDNGLRKLGDRYLVAMGVYYGDQIGTKIDITLDTGRVINCILAEVKKPKDTDPTHRVGKHNDTVEFIVDTDLLHAKARYDGDISSIPGFNGCVSTVTISDNRLAIPDKNGNIPIDPLLG